MQVSFREWEDSACSRRAAALLGTDEAQVWMATVPPDEASLAALARTLSPDERERAERFRMSEPRRQFVSGRALLRQLLGACLNVESATLAFGYEPRGKPFLAQSAWDGDLRFNLSHSGRMVAIALTRGREVGVDVESIQRLEDWPLLAEQIFSPRELCELRSLPKTQQREAFFNGWTRKEAYLKATGEGLTDALPSVEVTLAPGKEPELLSLPTGPEAARQWAIRGIPLPPDFAGAVVFEQRSTAPASPRDCNSATATPGVRTRPWDTPRSGS
jgi:4'-phosphopantetheinyl transferase